MNNNTPYAVVQSLADNFEQTVSSADASVLSLDRDKDAEYIVDVYYSTNTKKAFQNYVALQATYPRKRALPSDCSQYDTLVIKEKLADIIALIDGRR